MRRPIDLRREDGVAMTEFALIIPVFMLDRGRPARLRPGVLLLDRDEPPGERGGALGGRRSQPVPAAACRDPPERGCRAPAARHRRLDGRVPDRTRTSASTSPTAAHRPRRARASEDPEAVHLRADPRRRDDHDPGHVDDADRAVRERTAPPDELQRRPRRRPDTIGSVHMSRLMRDERGGILVLAAVMIPVFLLLDGARRRRRELVHAQAAAPEQGRRRRARRRRRVPLAAQELPDEPGYAPAPRSATSRSATQAPRRPIAGTKYNQTINRAADLTVRVNASSATAATATDGGEPVPRHAIAIRRPFSPAGAIWTDVKVRETQHRHAVRQASASTSRPSTRRRASR